jgi:hypothetical protein
MTDLKQQLEQEQQEYQILSQTAAQLREQLSQVGQELLRREGAMRLLQRMMEANGKEEESAAQG